MAAFDDRILAAAAAILDAGGPRPDARAIRERVGDGDDITASLRGLAGEGYVEIIDTWRDNAIVREVTPKGRRRLAEGTRSAKARQLAGHGADRLVWPIAVIVIAALVLLYLGHR